VGTDWNDHHIYAWANLSEGNEAIYEYNYFENDAGTGAALHLYGRGYQVKDEPPDYHVFRYNLIRGNGFWGVLLDGSHSAVVNNSFSLEGQGNRAINLQGSDASYNVLRNNIISRPSYAPIIYEGNPLSRPSFNVVEFNLTDSGSVSDGTCDQCSVSQNRTGTSPGWVRDTPMTWSDFRLTLASQAIDAGGVLDPSFSLGLDPASAGWPPRTVDQRGQGSGWEIGAFVYR
jgi:hypothetical protein